jgi:cation diffusion facilitator family transporter
MLPDQYKGDFTLLSSEEDADSLVELGQWSASQAEKQPNIAKQHRLESSDVADAAAEAADLKLRVLCGLSLAHVLIQMTVSQRSGSLAMLSDSFHNLSDVASLVLALYVHRLQKRSFATARLPYGYRRAEVLGGLVNGVALIALCIYVTLSAIPEILAPEELDASWLFISIAGSGVLVNLVGVLMFSGNRASSSSSDSKHTHCSTAAAAADGVELCSAVPHQQQQQRSYDHSHTHEHATVAAPSHCCSDQQQQQQQQQHDHTAHCCGSPDSEEAADLHALISLLSGSSSTDDVNDVQSCTVFGAGASAAATADRNSSCCSSVQTSSTASSVSDDAAVTPKCVAGKCATAHSATTAAAAVAAYDDNDSDNDSECESDTAQPWYAHSHSHHHHHTRGNSCSHSHSGCSSSSSSSSSGGSLNLWAVFVHSAMDALASGVICLGALVMRFAGTPGQLVSE